MSEPGLVAVLGSVNIDVAAYAATLPVPGQTVHGDTYAIGLGGKGCNQAIAAARLGATTHLIGRVGTDDFGLLAMSSIEGLGLRVDGLSRDPVHATGVALIGVDAEGRNAITVIGGANLAIDASDVDRARPVLERASILLTQLETPLAAGLLAADIVRAAGGLVILDPAPAPPGGLDDASLRRVDVVTPNEAEAMALTGIRPNDPLSAAAAARALRDRGARAAVITLGGAGVFFSGQNEEGFVPAFAVRTVDSVAAGDCFNGGLATALAEGGSLAESVRFAAACGALSTTRRGAAVSAPGRDAVEAMLASAPSG